MTCRHSGRGFGALGPLLVLLLTSACSSDEKPPPDGTGGGAGSGGSLASGGNGTSGGTAGTSTGGTGTGGTSTTFSGTGGTTGTGGSTNLPAFDAGDDSLNAVTAGNVCERIAEIQCAGQEHCCHLQHADKATCIAAQRDGCVNGGLDYVTAQAASGFDAANAASIVKAFETSASNCDPGIAKAATSTDGGLRSLVKGTLDSGADCTAGATVDGKVVAAHLASCANADQTACLPHQITTQSLFPKWLCTPLSIVGKNCFTDVNCNQTADIHGVYCNNDLQHPVISDNWQCMPRHETNEPCDSGNQCASLLCTKGATHQNPGVCLEANADNAYCLN